MKTLHKLLIGVAMLIAFNTTHSVLAQEADLDAGENIFTANCAACHAGGNNVINPEKTLKLDVLHINSMDSIDAITKQITNGKNAMPAFGGRLSEDDIYNAANYVLNQAKTDNW